MEVPTEDELTVSHGEWIIIERAIGQRVY